MTRPVERRRLRGEQRLVGKRLAETRHLARAHHDHMLDARALTDHRREQGRERVIDDDHAVLRVIDDLRQLRRWQPQVEGVEDRAHGRDGEVRLQVLLVVPGERAHAIAGDDPEPAQRAGETVHTLRHLGIAGVPGLLALERDDLAVREHRGAVAEELGDAQRRILHGRVHGSTLLCAFWRCPQAGARLRSSLRSYVPPRALCSIRAGMSLRYPRYPWH